MGVSQSLQVLLNDIESAMVLTLTMLKSGLEVYDRKYGCFYIMIMNWRSFL